LDRLAGRRTGDGIDGLRSLSADSAAEPGKQKVVRRKAQAALECPYEGAISAAAYQFFLRTGS